MCRRRISASLVDVCGTYIDNSLMLMGGAAVNPLCVDGTPDCSDEINHFQSQWFCTLDVMVYEIFTNFDERHACRWIFFFTFWCGHSILGQIINLFLLCLLQMPEIGNLLAIFLSNICSWESLNIFKVNLKTFLFHSYMSSDVPYRATFICIHTAGHSLNYVRRVL